ncbi:hypothetical protein, partial [Yoonia sediminilitoris]|uniref:hypothetical protein n=1 Tax=Yoonia sediminilitoris TaxID=1286148 RepID=UPI001B3B35EB
MNVKPQMIDRSQRTSAATKLKADIRKYQVKVRCVPVVSIGRCNTGFKFLCWGLVLQGLSGALVKLA